MNCMLSELHDNAKAIRALVAKRKSLLEHFLQTCHYPNKNEITINRISTYFDEIVTPDIMLETYRRKVHESSKQKEHEDFILEAHCRKRTVYPIVPMCIVYQTDGRGFYFHYSLVGGGSYVTDLAHAISYVLGRAEQIVDDEIAENHAKEIMARKIQRFVRETYARPGGLEYEKAKARWESMVDTRMQP